MQGDKYWEFENRDAVVLEGELNERFPGLPSGVDAVFIWTGNGKTYAIKGEFAKRSKFTHNLPNKKNNNIFILDFIHQFSYSYNFDLFTLCRGEDNFCKSKTNITYTQKVFISINFRQFCYLR